MGRAFVYRDVLTRDLNNYKIYEQDLVYELKRLRGSIDSVKKDLYKLSKTVSQNIGSDNASIFDAQRALLDDEQFLNDLESELHNELINAEQVAKNVFRKYILRISASSSEIVRAKAEDLRDIFHKVIRKLTGIDTSVLEKLPANAIVVATRLLPSDTIRLDRRNVAGIIVQEGSVHSHSALLARSLGIPSICMEDQPIYVIEHGDELILDGINGIVYHRPDTQIREEFEQRKRDLFQEVAEKRKTAHVPAVTRKGLPIKFYANVNNELDILQATSSGCEGIGLFRLENIYLESRLMPNEQELYDRLRGALKHLGDGKVITIRLLDIGGDKGLPYLGNGGEIDSFLGLRGIRLLLENPNLLLTQLRVIIRLHQEFNVRLLIPMITTVKEIVRVRDRLDESYRHLRQQHPNAELQPLLVGAMIETPAAVLSIKEVLKVSDYVSIGTNDLIQYTMAASRGDPEVADYYDMGQKVILPFIRDIATAAAMGGKECSVCGEMANDKVCLEDLIKAGIHTFSVNPSNIAALKAFVGGVDYP